MKATDVQTPTDCPICDGSGRDPVGHWNGEEYIEEVCRLCGGSGTASAYGEKHNEVTPSEHDHYTGDRVRMYEEVRRGRMLTTIQLDRVTDTGGFDAMFGPEEPAQIPSDAPQDLKDRLQNSLGNVGPYDSFGASDLKGGTYPRACADCESGDLCRGHCLSWLRARGDDVVADRLETLFDRVGV